MPQISSGYSFGLGINVGSRSICHPSTPFTRARSAKMRQAAPVFDAAQQQSGSILQQGCARVEHAVDGVRPILARQDGVGRMTQKQWRVVSAFDVHKRCFGSSHEGSSAFRQSCLQRAHFQQCHQERQRGFRSLILIGAVGMQAVPATAGFRIVKRKLEIVVAQEPVERRPGLHCASDWSPVTR